MQDPTEHIQAGAKRVTEFFRSGPHSVLAMEDHARKMLLGALEAKEFRFLMVFMGLEA
jgi:hypothetical protein